MTLRRMIALIVVTCSLFVVSPWCAYPQAASADTTMNAGSPDKVLLDRAMEAMTNAQYFEARSLLETLIDTHPDSPYVPFAKLSIGNAWYDEGNLKQAEVEYRDFVTFFPNRFEVADARSKIDAIQKKLENLR